MQRLVLIDGNAIMHRAFHALPPLTNPKGETVNAAYGFFSMLLKIIEDANPTHIAVCFDRPKPTFRQSLFVGYQAQRPKTADGLGPQFGIVHKALEQIGAPVFEVDGYEADDVISTIATKATKKSDTEVIIVTGDRDLLQLVNLHVKVLSPVTGISNMVLYDEEKVEERFGIKPSQIVDYKALVGDASDNYPGVAGIGPKTAIALFQKYGTLENIYLNLSEIPEKISLKLMKDAEQASLCKKLATLVCDAPIQFDFKKCTVDHYKSDALQSVFSQLGFKSLEKRAQEVFGMKFLDNRQKTKKKKGNVTEQLGFL